MPFSLCVQHRIQHFQKTVKAFHLVALSTVQNSQPADKQNTRQSHAKAAKQMHHGSSLLFTLSLARKR